MGLSLREFLPPSRVYSWPSFAYTYHLHFGLEEVTYSHIFMVISMWLIHTILRVIEWYLENNLWIDFEFNIMSTLMCLNINLLSAH